MGMFMIRYGEIALKGQNRTYFLQKLRRNIRVCLRSHGLGGRVWQEGQRIYLETESEAEALAALQRVFGIVSLSPVRVVCPNLEAMQSEAVAMASSAGLGPQQSFRVRARRADKSFPCTSPEIERAIGAAVVQASGARVDLSHAVDLELGVEVHSDRALMFGETVAGPGGMPVGSQGKVVALLSTGIDSPVAAWMMMKRGCSVIPVHFSSSASQSEQVQALVDALNRYGYGWRLKPVILPHELLVAPIMERLRQMRAERWACLFCKRAMLRKATDLATQMGAHALVTGDSLGQVASQTLSNLEAISLGIPKPILRPLIGWDKVEITALARAIGTYDVSAQQAHSCPYLPSRPLTKARMARLMELIDELEEPSEARSSHSSPAVGGMEPDA